MTSPAGWREPIEPDAVCVVTGAARGLGAAVAREFANLGGAVIAVDRDRTVETVAEEIGGEPLVADLTDEDGLSERLDDLISRLGVPAILVNAAGVVAPHGSILDDQAEQFERVLAVNTVGTARITRLVGSRMAAAGRGSIVMVSSIGAMQPTRGLALYEASKAALDSLARASALELASSGVRVNSVAPGPIDTPMTERLRSDPVALKSWTDRIPLGRIAGVDDVVPAIVFLASRLAAHITGSTIVVDGGRLLV